jgi:molybdate transport system substrate-binding protein
MKKQSILPTLGLGILFVLLAAFLLLPGFFDVKPAQLRIAVAANFIVPMQAVVGEFEKQNNIKVDLSPASTGTLFTQIENGAPYDLFFAADIVRPKKLEDEGRIIVDSRFTYAIGKIVLWGRDDDLAEDFADLESILSSDRFRRLSIANPDLAPYGEAAQEALQQLGDWDDLQSKIVRGENINQAYQFVRSGNAQLGIIALSQITRPDREISGSHWEIPEALYKPIEQQAVILSESTNQQMAASFMEFMKSDEIGLLIREFGYKLPSE